MNNEKLLSVKTQVSLTNVLTTYNLKVYSLLDEIAHRYLTKIHLRLVPFHLNEEIEELLILCKKIDEIIYGKIPTFITARSLKDVIYEKRKESFVGLSVYLELAMEEPKYTAKKFSAILQTNIDVLRDFFDEVMCDLYFMVDGMTRDYLELLRKSSSISFEVIDEVEIISHWIFDNMDNAIDLLNECERRGKHSSNYFLRGVDNFFLDMADSDYYGGYLLYKELRETKELLLAELDRGEDITNEMAQEFFEQGPLNGINDTNDLTEMKMYAKDYIDVDKVKEEYLQSKQ